MSLVSIIVHRRQHKLCLTRHLFYAFFFLASKHKRRVVSRFFLSFARGLQTLHVDETDLSIAVSDGLEKTSMLNAVRSNLSTYRAVGRSSCLFVPR